MPRKSTILVIVLLALSVLLIIYVVSLSSRSNDLSLSKPNSDEAIVSAAPAASTSDEPEELTETLVDVKAAWTRRQMQIPQFYCRWSAETTWPENSFVGDGLSIGKFIPGPSEDTTISESLECWVKGSQLRFLHAGPKWIGEAGQFMLQEHLSLNSDEARLFYVGGDEASGEQFHPTAMLDAPGRNNSADHVHLTPLFLVFRPLDARFGEAFDLASFERADEDGAHGNTGRLVIKQRGPDESKPIYALWLDAERDYLPTRVEKHFRGRILMEIAINYQEEAVGVWLPNEWKTILYSSPQDLTSAPQIKLRITARVIRCAPSPALSNDDFKFAIPAGTVVIDSRTNNDYLLRQNGSKRMISQHERIHRVPYADLVATNTDQAVSPRFKALLERIDAISEQPGQDDQATAIEDITEYFEVSHNAPANVHLARIAAGRLRTSNDIPAALAVLRGVANVIGQGSEDLSEFADRIEGTKRRQDAVGQQFELTGTRLDGLTIDADALRGKVVLVSFWFMGCRPCIEEFASLKEIYQRYHNKGLEIVGVTSDHDVGILRSFLYDHEIPWVNLYSNNDDPQSTIRRYGISIFPTNVLVGKDGKVIAVYNDCAGLLERVAELVAD